MLMLEQCDHFTFMYFKKPRKDFEKDHLRLSINGKSICVCRYSCVHFHIYIKMCVDLNIFDKCFNNVHS